MESFNLTKIMIENKPERMESLIHTSNEHNLILQIEQNPILPQQERAEVGPNLILPQQERVEIEAPELELVENNLVNHEHQPDNEKVITELITSMLDLITQPNANNSILPYEVTVTIPSTVNILSSKSRKRNHVKSGSDSDTNDFTKKLKKDYKAVETITPIVEFNDTRSNSPELLDEETRVDTTQLKSNNRQFTVKELIRMYDHRGQLLRPLDCKKLDVLEKLANFWELLSNFKKAQTITTFIETNNDSNRLIFIEGNHRMYILKKLHGSDILTKKDLDTVLNIHVVPLGTEDFDKVWNVSKILYTFHGQADLSRLPQYIVNFLCKSFVTEKSRTLGQLSFVDELQLYLGTFSNFIDKASIKLCQSSKEQRDQFYKKLNEQEIVLHSEEFFNIYLLAPLTKVKAIEYITNNNALPKRQDFVDSLLWASLKNDKRTAHILSRIKPDSINIELAKKMIDQIKEGQEHDNDNDDDDEASLPTISELTFVTSIDNLDEGSFIVTRKPLDLDKIKKGKMTVMYLNCPSDYKNAAFDCGLTKPLIVTGKIAGTALLEKDKLDYFLFGPAIKIEFTKVVATSLKGQWREHLEKSYIRKHEIKLFAIRGTMNP